MVTVILEKPSSHHHSLSLPALQEQGWHKRIGYLSTVFKKKISSDFAKVFESEGIFLFFYWLLWFLVPGAQILEGPSLTSLGFYSIF